MVVLPDPAEWAPTFAKSRLIVVNVMTPEDVARWRQTAVDIVARHGHGVNASSHGKSGSSIHQDSGDRLAYTVIAGDTIRDQFTEAWDFYQSSATKEWIDAVTGGPAAKCSSSILPAVNINSLKGPPDRYPWHFDLCPYTLTLYLTSLCEEDGGQFEYYPNVKDGDYAADPEQVTHPNYLASRQRFSILPRAGMLVLMDGALTLHRVAPTLRTCLRLSMPMAYPVTPYVNRPAHDAYVYGRSA